MASEEKDILAKISQLAGQINRHKNGQQGTQAHPVSYPTRTHSYPSYVPGSSGYRSRGAYSGRGSARGGRVTHPHRHRTLVLNGNGSTESTANNTDTEAATNTPPSGSGWVSKTDRHMQLINTSVFEKDRQARAIAIEETRQQKLKQRDERERNRFNKHLQRVGGNAYAPGHSSKSKGNYELTVQGIRFHVAKNGSKLVKVPGKDSTSRLTIARVSRPVGMILCSSHTGDINAAKATPKTALVGNVKFHRSKNGNMYRAGILKAYRRNGVVRKINEPCKRFTTTGSCLKGPKCQYVHNPSKVAVCKEFLQKGQCPSGDSCDLSHQLTPERTPFCLHFAKGSCSNSNCRYMHVRVSPAALVCRPFGIYGYCETGSSCQERHVHECPDFSNTGTCNTKGCKLLHRHKASVMRSNTALGDPITDGEISDISSDDDDEEIDSEDVDSDDLDEEFFGDRGEEDTDIPTQQDYVQLK